MLFGIKNSSIALVTLALISVSTPAAAYKVYNGTDYKIYVVDFAWSSDYIKPGETKNIPPDSSSIGNADRCPTENAHLSIYKKNGWPTAICTVDIEYKHGLVRVTSTQPSSKSCSTGYYAPGSDSTRSMIQMEKPTTTKEIAPACPPDNHGD
ncbi:MAG: hypothetical protein A3C55_03390 [Gammaproteobacteria bacterium RIFCSPHIGHO2_02_FULL_42_13]|nr:MAG: hypothetical protein A3C55_03390 [Gammaproteobacteria bacterium RIFCSPHIGHO2_02_FULL_42_13]OGT70455.1 MAG: hypothetical protein A3H43_06155 [Gammaproteobacteria bacterium RIFCSPLOWO2_02_FULL_42_9]